MKKKVKIILILFILLITLGLSLYLFINEFIGYAMIFIVLSAILFLLLVTSGLKKEDNESVYRRELKQILKKYDAILVETSTIPDMDDKNIMLITNIEDMIDASVEIRKPIYYKKENGYCIFILLDNQDICIYVLKSCNDTETAIEMFVKERKENIENLIGAAREAKKVKVDTNKNEINKKEIEDMIKSYKKRNYDRE